MGRLRESIDALPPDSRFPREEVATGSRRHRPVVELRISDGSVEDAPPTAEMREALDTLDLDGLDGPNPIHLADAYRVLRRATAPFGNGALTDDLRASLWEVIELFLFAPVTKTEAPGDAAWTGSTSSALARPSVQRVWSSPPISGDSARIPEDLATVLAGWFSLVEAGDVYAFVETVHDSLESQHQPRFAAQCNAALERGLSDHRFVLRRLVPIASRADVAIVEKALADCAAWEAQAGTALVTALGHLAAKPEPNGRGTVQEAVRAVEIAAFALTGERLLTLEDTLLDLRSRGITDDATVAAHRGLHAFATSSAQKATTEGARRVLVMCSAFVSHLATRAKVLSR